MPAAPLPSNESIRLKSLLDCKVLDTQAEQRFDDLTALAARLCSTPIALISLIDHDRQWFKSRYGLDAQETPREQAFCGYTILDNKPLVITDATKDPRTCDNPLVTGELGISFYAGVPLKLATGEAIGTLCVIDRVPREITDEQMKDLVALARQAASQMELNRSNARLSMAAEEARRANHAKSAFLANMSHEIRTPLTAIAGYADLLASPDEITEGALDQGELASSIQRNSRHLLALINDVLDLSRIESGRLNIDRLPGNPALEIQHAIEIASPLADSKDITLSLTCEGVPDQMMIDPTRLRQIALNLIGNALKFTTRGEVAASLSYDSSTQELEFVLRDTGIGMNAEQLDRIRRFEAFNQADASTTRQFGGSGLGLKISHQLSQLMGGGITVDSIPGKGTTFTVILLASAVEARQEILMDGLDQKGDETGPVKPLHGIRILLAEDGPDNQRLITHHLKHAGAEVILAVNGQAACDLMLDPSEPANIDLIMMDINMPIMDGYEATKKIRAQGLDLPIIALTASATSSDCTKAREAGCNVHLAKPYDRHQLVAVCSGLIETKKVRDQQAA